MERFKRFLRSRRTDERGAVLIFTAVSMVLLLWAGAAGVDVGFTVFGSRQAQAMADSASLDLARYINYADSINSNSALTTYLNGKLAGVETDNGSDAHMTVVPGLWMNGTFTANGQGGKGCASTTPPAPFPCNALMVTAAQAVPQIFFGGFTSPTGRGSSIAADTPEAGFSIGTYLANYNSQQTLVLNDVLGALGDEVDLTAVGYQGLANSYISLNQLITASGGLLTPTNVLSASLTGQQWLTIFTNAIGNQVSQLNCGGSPEPSPCEASAALKALDFSASTSASLCQMVSINGSTCSSGVLSPSALNATLDLGQTLNTEAELANGTNALDVTSALNLSVLGLTISKVTLSLKLIEPPQVAYGPVGTTASSAQVSEDLQVQLPLFGTLDIPLSAADGTSTLNTINCTGDSMFNTKINSTTTAATGAVTLAGASLATVSVGGVSTTGTSYSGPASGTNVVPPTASTQAAGTNPKTIGTTTPNLSFAVLGIPNPLISGLLSAITSSALGPVLQAAGVTLAGASVADLSTNCDAISIVQ